jgi:hypothetical protein
MQYRCLLLLSAVAFNKKFSLNYTQIKQSTTPQYAKDHSFVMVNVVLRRR